MNSNNLESQAKIILESLVATTFEQCLPITRDFRLLTVKASLYAVRHREDGLLYIGKTRYTKERFRGGHKAFLWAWLDRYDVADVRVVIYPLNFVELQTLSSDLEAILIAATQPPYNARYPVRD